MLIFSIILTHTRVGLNPIHLKEDTLKPKSANLFLATQPNETPSLDCMYKNDAWISIKKSSRNLTFNYENDARKADEMKCIWKVKADERTFNMANYYSVFSLRSSISEQDVGEDNKPNKPLKNAPTDKRRLEHFAVRVPKMDCCEKPHGNLGKNQSTKFNFAADFWCAGELPKFTS